MARPEKPKADRKDTDLRIPVTAKQKELILRAVKLGGMDMAAWARPLLLKEAQALLESARVV
jgi:hypothetical protein